MARKIAAALSLVLCALTCNAARLKQELKKSTVGEPKDSECTKYEINGLADCNFIVVRTPSCKEKCKTFCGPIDAKTCQSNPFLNDDLCKEECANAMKQSASSVDGDSRCAMVKILDQCEGPIKDACKKECGDLLERALKPNCVDFQQSPAVVKVQIAKNEATHGIHETTADWILAKHPFLSPEVMRTKFSYDHAIKKKFEKLLPTLAAISLPPFGSCAEEPSESPVLSDDEHEESAGLPLFFNEEPPTSIVKAVATEKKEPLYMESVNEDLGGVATFVSVEYPSNGVSDVAEEDPPCVDINGGVEQLAKIYGIGRKIAGRIVALRQQENDFIDWGDFDEKVKVKSGRSSARNQRNVWSPLQRIVQEKCLLFCELDGSQHQPCGS